MAFGPLQALLIAQVGAPSRGSEASKGRPDPLGQGCVIALPTSASPQGQPRQVALKAPSWRPSKGPSDEIGRIQQAEAMARSHQGPAESGDQPLVNGGGTLLKNEVHGSGPPGNLC